METAQEQIPMNLRIEALEPGEEMEISRAGEVRVTVERSSDGKTLRFVRHTADGFTVFQTCNF